MPSFVPFDPFAAPVTGTHLVEASAGTGKTYAIASLYARLVVETGLAVREILVVTYTQAATAELASRIRQTLVAVLAAADGKTDTDLVVTALADRLAGDPGAVRRVRQAISDFDEAAIHTIHAFCHRLLQENAFETGVPFEAELVSDALPYVSQTAADFWRRRIYSLPGLVTRRIESLTGGPAHFVRRYRALNAPGLRILAPAVELNPAEVAGVESGFRDLGRQWGEEREEILHLLRDPALKGNIYGGIEARGSGPSPREERVATLASDLDDFFDASLPDLPTPEAMNRFRADLIETYVRKGHAPPHHSFFGRCAAFVDAAAALDSRIRKFLGRLEYDFLESVNRRLDELKSAAGIWFFDDLLVRVHAGLSQPGAGRLKAAVQDRFRAALVDEFQDTDTCQFEIFSHLFSRSDQLLLMIGDPKQAIYGFRGADIFSYLKAADQSRTRFGLPYNWRSTPGLIRAVNTLFSRAAEPFVLEGIRFDPVSAPPNRESTGDGDPAMTIWTMPPTENGKPWPKQAARDWIADAVAGEIRRLTDGKAPAGCRPGDVAVLVRTNDQALRMADTLRRLGVPAVLHSTAGVFATHEAMELRRVLSAVAEPAHGGLLKAALVTDMIGFTAAAVDDAEDPGRLLAEHQAFFSQMRRLWESHGFMRMFRTLLVSYEVRKRLLGFADGPRRLTNLLHLAELAHGADADAHGPLAVLTWLADQQQSPNPPGEADQLRLETDAEAVQLVTVHRSKGLEYPVVFCPFAWDVFVPRDPDIRFHDPAQDDAPTLDLCGEDPDHRRQWDRETLAEDLRLFYVAATRARNRLVLTWGRLAGAGVSGMAYLLHPELRPDSGAVAEAGNREKTFRSIDDSGFFGALSELAAQSDGAIAVQTMPEPDPEAGPASFPDQLPTPCRVFSGRIDTSWQVTSYSALAAGRHEAAESLFRVEQVAESEDPVPVLAEGPSSDIRTFPRGADAGQFFHELLENADFKTFSPETGRSWIRERLQRAGYTPDWESAVSRLMADLVRIPLHPNVPGLHLSRLSQADRVNEMEFYFPLKRITAGDLGQALPGPTSGDPAPDPEKDRFHFRPVEGFVKGFIDLWFRFEDRYYLIDWKSNDLGPTPADYGTAAMGRAMHASAYTLQYHLYVVALDRYLRCRVPGYTYATGFGGVFYVFLRGIPDRAEETAAVFFDRPDEARIRRLDRLFAE